MEFCPRCGAILIQKRKNYGCPRCNYASKDKIKIEIKEKISGGREIAVVKENDAEVLPEVKIKCKKCGHNKAYFWTSQTRSSDEAETKFYRCAKCRFTWKDYK